jgi:hypothetical protein
MKGLEFLTDPVLLKQFKNKYGEDQHGAILQLDARDYFFPHYAVQVTLSGRAELPDGECYCDTHTIAVAYTDQRDLGKVIVAVMDALGHTGLFGEADSITDIKVLESK